jgi:Protein of unknown function (DUF2892)
MEKNLVNADRIIRLLVAMVLIVLNVDRTIPGYWGVIAWVFAIMFLVTGLAGFCPLYSLFGIRTSSDTE